MSESELLEFLYSALHSECGLVLETDNVEFLRQKLYPLRKRDPALMVLSFVVSPSHPASHLWVVKRQELPK